MRRVTVAEMKSLIQSYFMCQPKVDILVAVEIDESIIYTISFPSQIRENILEMMEV